MSQVSISAPLEALTIIHIEPGQSVAFNFDPSGAQFERVGDNLQLTLENGNELLLEGFFVPGEGGSLPELVFEDGTAVSGSDFLASVNPEMDLTPAAGSVASGGSGSYNDNAGELVNGLEGSDSLDPIAWSVASSGGQTLISAAGVLSTDVAADPGTATPVQPGPIVDYQARAVFFDTQNQGQGGTLNFRVNGSGAVSIESKNGFVDESSLSVSYDADGNPVYSISLSAEGQQAMAEALAAAGGNASRAGNIYDYITITVNGQSYVMQVVFNQNGQYSAAAEDALNRPDTESGSILGEYHTENNATSGAGRVSSEGGDEFWLQGGMVGNTSVNAGNGDNSVHLGNRMYADGQNNSLLSGSGQDNIDINGHIWATNGGENRIATGAGDDNLDVKGWVYAVNGASNDISLGDGNDTMTVADQVYAYTGSSNHIDLGQGENSLAIQNGSLWAHGGNNTVSGGDGGNEINVGWEMSASLGGRNEIRTGSGDDVVEVGTMMRAEGGSNIIDTGAGADEVTVNQWVYATGGGSNAINTGEGNINVNGSVYAWEDTGSGKASSNTLNAGGTIRVDNNGESGGILTGVQALRHDAENTLTAGGEVVVSVQNTLAGAKGIYGEGDTTSNIITAGGTVSVDVYSDSSTNTSNTTHEAMGMWANQGSKLEVTAKEGSIMVAATGAGKSSATALSGNDSTVLTAENGGIHLNAHGARGAAGVHGSADINARYVANIGAYAETGGAVGINSLGYSNVDIDVTGENGIANINAFSAGALADGSAYHSRDAYGIKTTNTSSTTVDAETISVTASSYGSNGDFDAYGMYTDGFSSNGTTQSVLTGKHINVSASVDNGNAQAMYASVSGSALGNETVNVVQEMPGTEDSRVTVMAVAESGGTATGLHAEGRGAENQIRMDHVDVHAVGDQSAIGLEAVNGGKNTVQADSFMVETYNNVYSAAGDPSSAGLYASGSGTSAGQNVIKAAGDSISVNINASSSGGGFNQALFASGSGSYNNIAGGKGDDDVTLTGSVYATGNGQNIISLGNGDNTVIMNSGHLWAEGGRNSITATGDGDNTISINGNQMRATGGGSNTISTTNGADNITVGSHMWAAGGTNTINTGMGADNVAVNGWVYATEGGKNVIDTAEGNITVNNGPVYAWEESGTTTASSNTLTAGGDITVRNTQGNDHINSGVEAMRHDTNNTLKAGGNIIVDVQNDKAGSLAVNGEGSTSSNVLNAGGDITITSRSDTSGNSNTTTHEAMGLYANQGSELKLNAENGNISVTSTGIGNSTATALSGSHNTYLTAQRGQVTLEASGARGATGLHGSAVIGAGTLASIKVDAASGNAAGINSQGGSRVDINVSESGGLASIVAQGQGVHNPYTGSSQSQNVYAMKVGNDSNVKISADNIQLVAAVTGESSDFNAYGMYVNGFSAQNKTTSVLEGNNISVEASVAEGGNGNAYAMYAHTEGSALGKEASNIIQAAGGEHALVVTITAEAGSAGQAVAMFSQGNGAVNIIRGGELDDSITISGDLTAESGGINLIDAGNGNNEVNIAGNIGGDGENRIVTGGGDDFITLHGAVEPGSLTLITGEGYDTLVLVADSVEDFNNYYRDWLENVSEQDFSGLEGINVNVSGEVDLGGIGWISGAFGGLDVTFNGGNGMDTLNVDGFGDGNLTLAGLADLVDGFEVIDLGGNENTVLTIGDLLDGLKIDSHLNGDLLESSGLNSDLDLLNGTVLRVNGSEGDNVVLEGPWSGQSAGTVTYDSVTYNVYTNDLQSDQYLLIQQSLNS